MNCNLCQSRKPHLSPCCEPIRCECGQLVDALRADCLGAEDGCVWCPHCTGQIASDTGEPVAVVDDWGIGGGLFY